MKTLLKLSSFIVLFLVLVAAIMWLVGLTDFTNINLAVYWSIFVFGAIFLINLLFGFKDE